MSVLDEAAKLHPDTWSWVKPDGVDLVCALGESMRGIWSGDGDLADGSLQKEFGRHQQRLEFFSELGYREVLQDMTLPSDLKIGIDLLTKDVEHIYYCKLIYII